MVHNGLLSNVMILVLPHIRSNKECQIPNQSYDYDHDEQYADVQSEQVLRYA